MPKILKMPTPGQQFKSKNRAGTVLPPTASADHIQLPKEQVESSEIARISDCLKLADQVLGDTKTRKKA